MPNPLGINQYTNGARRGIGSKAMHNRQHKKLSIQTAAIGLSKKGLKLGAGKYNPKTRSTSYQVTDRRGKTVSMTAKHISSLL